MEAYTHTVQYYETDKMGIVHHSNYIRWMEEARTDCLRQLGWPYEKLEEEGIVSPVTALDCRYRAGTVFPERIRIEVAAEEFRGAVLKLRYVMTNGDGKTVCEGHSEHCFLDRDGRVMRLNREAPAFYERLKAWSETGV